MISNWTKYEEIEPDDDDQQLSAADFERLLITPASLGSHFVFSTEKNWGDDDSATELTQFFKLNLTNLAKSLTTIPFYKRQSYCDNLFDANELVDMDVKAMEKRRFLSDFTAVAATTEPTVDAAVQPPPAAMPASEKASSKVTAVTNEFLAGTIEAGTIEVDDDDELNDLLMIDAKPVVAMMDNNRKTVESKKLEDPPVPVSAATPASSNDIQQWLDDILDD